MGAMEQKAPEQALSETQHLGDDRSAGKQVRQGLGEALSYAGRGWPVFPLHTPQGTGCSCGRPGCQHAGKHPRTEHGVLDASTDPTVVQDWWRKWPDANTGIATGATSGLVVIDVDPRHGGDETLAAWTEEHGPLPDTVEVVTGQAGRHLYFRHPGDPVKSRTIGPGVDVKADGGYVVAPPSLHATGRHYQWELSSDPDDVPVAALPEWLLALVTAGGADGPGSVAAGPAPVIRAGNRNTALTQLAGGLRRVGLQQSELEVTLQAINTTRCQPALPREEVARIAQSVAKYAPGPAAESSSPYSESESDESPVELSTVPLPGPRRWVVDGLLPQGVMSVLYGEGGMAKSLLALLFGDFVARGDPIFGRAVLAGPVLYLDWELDQDEQARRAYQVARGLGRSTPTPSLFYRQMGLPLDGELVRIEGWVREFGINLLVIDSFGLATIGDPLSAKDVVPLLAKVSQLPCSTLFIDHVRNVQPGERPDDLKPFGSVYKYNIARSVLRASRAAGDECSVTVILRQTKSNFGARAEPLGLRVTFEDTRICFEQLDPDSPLLKREDHGTSVERVYRALQQSGEASPEALAAVTHLTAGTVRNRLTELSRQGRATSDRKGTWRVADSSFSLPLYGDDETVRAGTDAEGAR